MSIVNHSGTVTSRGQGTDIMDLPAVGTRISLAGSRGTIRFVGHVNNAQGVWLGVEWDEPDRGKHNGVKEGKQYFSCRWVASSDCAVLYSQVLLPSGSQIQGLLSGHLRPFVMDIRSYMP